ncbi:MAG: hypothetical protein UT24_C0018G0024 [Candidatus Woesebacteria bacterium GW2011_GWB1_39_12]|uniref:Uncharacterized protein n=1 Tax=Candidatus Woesebacteria bacterium GW2011_GWB1_39_12 TaxID=1618574 RepID=A0A0G0QE87_9BACT|nr:MAG: hypothetical protein UT24_C0018G0024 [Candidatus Woesebacteria bacterium GW2011_GWB1_39_12]
MEEIILNRSDVIQDIIDALGSSSSEVLANIYETIVGSEITYIGQDQFQMWSDDLEEDEDYSWDHEEDEEDEFDF